MRDALIRRLGLLVFLAGLIPLGVVLVWLQARGQDNWAVVAGAVAYLFGLRRLGGHLERRAKGTPPER